MVSTVWGIQLKVDGIHNLHGHGGTPGQPHTRIPCVAVGNHQSELDFLIGGHLCPPGFIPCSTWWVRGLPLLGLVMRIGEAIFFDPPPSSSMTNSRILVDTAEKLRNEGLNLFIYPEGRRSHSTQPTLLPLRRGAFVVALEAGYLPIVAVVCANFSHIFHFPSKHIGRGTIRVRILSPVEWDTAEGEANDHAIKRMVEIVHDKMIHTLREISE
ncbi:hypothetical protein GQ53DRAFT_672683 [Thozetella sp. PMI_491]|nr:hypothetical protein GQ53DRAFT_672683 [Thozetella sp. PMI_491]